MNAPISRFTPVLLAGLTVLVAACSATGAATATPQGASSGPPPATSAAPASPSQTSPVQGSPVPGSPTPGGAAAAPLCPTAQLTLQLGGGMVRDGAGIYYIYFKNAGAAACTLTGYPGVSAVTGPSDSASQIGSDAKRTATSLVRPQLVEPGHTVEATLSFAGTGNFVSPQCQHVRVTFVKVFPPGDTTASYIGGLDEQICAETTLPTMSITAVGPDPE